MANWDSCPSKSINICSASSNRPNKHNDRARLACRAGEYDSGSSTLLTPNQIRTACALGPPDRSSTHDDPASTEPQSHHQHSQSLRTSTSFAEALIRTGQIPYLQQNRGTNPTQKRLTFFEKCLLDAKLSPSSQRSKASSNRPCIVSNSPRLPNTKLCSRFSLVREKCLLLLPSQRWPMPTLPVMLVPRKDSPIAVLETPYWQ